VAGVLFQFGVTVLSGRTWVAADHHFGHINILNFKREDGTPLRPFKNIEEHDEEIIRRHNAVVGETDRVYLLGDVCINRRSLHQLGRLNGRLVLVKGNHDIFKLADYLPFFDDIRAYVVQKDHEGNKVILSHIPIHKDSVGRLGTNIHGHLHYQRIDDPQYVCVSLEHTDYSPIEISTALKLRGVRKL
jgi:calcineurin-like phosphoesterase family protein